MKSIKTLLFISMILSVAPGYGQTLWQADSSGTYIFNTNSGAVGIGTVKPDAAYKLSVAGKIRAKDIKVEANWADFVFEDGYKLRSLAEVEHFIGQNRHLPDIPSQAEVQSNGVAVGEMQARLLRKIEELALYVIELDKEGRELETRLDLLRK